MAIFIHIGINKTGTSSLQKFCYENRALLAAHGLVYPEAGIHCSAHYGLSKMLIGMPPDESVAPPEDFEQIISTAVGRGQDVLVSSEYLFTAADDDVSQIYRYFSRFDVSKNIIVYLRRHDLWIKSLFNQKIKTSYGLCHSDIRDYVISLLGANEFDIQYSRMLDRWAGHFGTENVIVKPFETSQFHSGELLWDFLSAIRDDLPSLLQQENVQAFRVNDSIPDHVLGLISHARGASLDSASKDAITDRILSAESVRSPAAAQPSWDTQLLNLPLDLRQAIVAFFARDYAYIAKKYLRADGRVLFRDPVE